MEYAIVEAGGKQYRISPNTILDVESLGKKAGETVNFDKVLLYVVDGDIKIGSPYVSGVSISATVVSDVKGEKIRVSKFLAKSRYRRVKGHRQALTRVQVSELSTGKPKTTAPTVAAEATVPVSKPVKSRATVKKTAKKA